MLKLVKDGAGGSRIGGDGLRPRCRPDSILQPICKFCLEEGSSRAHDLLFLQAQSSTTNPYSTSGPLAGESPPPFLNPLLSGQLSEP